MGFPEFKCKAALSKTGGATEAVRTWDAVNLLLVQ